MPGRLPGDFDAAVHPAGARARERGRIVRHPAHAHERLRTAVSVGEHDLDARRSRPRHHARRAGSGRERVEPSAAPVEDDEPRGPGAGVRDRDLEPRAVVLDAQRNTPPAEGRGRQRREIPEEPGPPAERGRGAGAAIRVRSDPRGDDLGQARPEALGSATAREITEEGLGIVSAAPAPLLPRLLHVERAAGKAPLQRFEKCGQGAGRGEGAGFFEKRIDIL